MNATVLISDIVDALQMQFDEQGTYLNLDTGEVEVVSTSLLREAEEAEEAEDDESEQEEDDEWELAKRIVSTDRFLRLPDKFEVNEWELMHDFALSAKPESLSQELLRALHGKGAFRYFKDVVQNRKLEQKWYAFRDEALKQVAIDWCKENKLAWR
jgi:hypothetical protein